ncbi:MAG: SHOCT domain-containing protein [Oscillospiraceae bacterium]|nr:SHOCT domain-containing protein [Oscillospiraceae bacterium]
MAERYKNTAETAESKISSLSRLNELKKDGAVSEEEFETLKAELLGVPEEKPAAPTEDISDFAGSLFTMESEPVPVIPEKDELPINHAAAAEEGLTNVTGDFDFSLDKGEPIITENAASGIDFDIHSDDAVIPDKSENSAEKRLSEIERYCMKQIDSYTRRDCALMDSEALSSLSSLPLFLVGAAAAIFFFFILKSFADMTGTLSELLIIFCICAGVAPACVIIPNTIKINKRNKTAKEYNDILTESYLRSGMTDIPFEYTNPYIIAELEDIIGSGRAHSITEAVDCLNDELSDSENLAAEKKRADLAENDELAARSAALYVLGKGLLNGI